MLKNKKLTIDNLFASEENDVKKTRSEWEKIIKEEDEYEFGSDELLDEDPGGKSGLEIDDKFIAKPKIFKNDDIEYKVFNIENEFFIKNESEQYLIKISTLELVKNSGLNITNLFNPIYYFKDSLTDEFFDYELVKEISESYDIFSEENEAGDKNIWPWDLFSI